MAELKNTTVTGKVTQSVAASAANDLTRKGEVDAALALKLDAAHASVTNARSPTGAVPGGDLTGNWQTGPTLVATGTAGTYTKVTTDAKGRVTAGTTLSAGDIPAHAATHKSGGTDAIRLDELAAPTASVALNAQKLTGVQDPSAAQDAATKAYVDARRLDQAAVPTASVNFNSQRATNVLDPSGAQDAATKAYVDARRLDQAAVPTASVNANSQKIINLLDPTLAQDAATKAYVDAAAQGLLIKTACRLATTANISLSGLAAIDGVTPVAGDRVLAKNQTDATQNGIYVAAAGAWTRAGDADTNAEVKSGMFTFISEGTANANNGFTLTTANPITLGVTALTFTQTSGAGQITAGSGLTKTGNTIAADFGTAAGKVCEGNDARLSDARQPAAAAADINANTHKVINVVDPSAAQDAATKNYVDTRKVHDFTAPTAALPMNAQKITGLADPTLAQDAATKAYVDARRLDQAAAPTASVNLNSQKLTSVLDPTAAQDAATKAYVDAVAQGLGNKTACRIATTANIALSGLAAIDGVTPVAGDRLLVKDQTLPEQNGIYVAAAGAWSRATDADISAEVKAGLYVFVSEGTANGDSGWTLTTNDPITLGTTGLVFTQFSGAGQITAGNGLAKTGNTLAVDFTKKWTDFAAPTADVDINTRKLLNVVDPTSAQHGATKNYVDTRKVHDFTAPTAALPMNAQKITGLADPTSPQDAATKNYADNQHKTGKLLFVDSVNGNDTTGTRGRSDLPYLTLTEAENDALGDDTIIVLPGTFNENGLGKNGVNWHFVLGAKINYSGAGTDPIFGDGAGALSFKVTGQGEFEVSGANAAVVQLIFVSTLHIEALRLKSAAGGSISLGAGSAVVKADVIDSTGFACFLGASATSDIQARQIIGLTALWIEETGTHNIRADLIQGSSAAVYIFDGNTTVITAREIKSTGHYAVRLETGGAPSQVTINGARIVSTLNTASGVAVYLAGAASAELTLKDCVLVSNVAGTPATVSIDSPAATNVRIYGSCMANLAKGANITFITGSTRFEVDADVR